MDEKNIFIGKKPSMNYVLAVVTHFNSGHDSVSIKARGRAISKAVDVAEIVRGRFIMDVNLDDVRIGTERIVDEDRRDGLNVSWIEINMSRPVQDPAPKVRVGNDVIDGKPDHSE